MSLDRKTGDVRKHGADVLCNWTISMSLDRKTGKLSGNTGQTYSVIGPFLCP